MAEKEVKADPENGEVQAALEGSSVNGNIPNFPFGNSSAKGQSPTSGSAATSTDLDQTFHLEELTKAKDRPSNFLNKFNPNQEVHQGLERHDQESGELTFAFIDQNGQLVQLNGNSKKMAGEGSDGAYWCTDHNGTTLIFKRYPIPQGPLSLTAEFAMNQTGPKSNLQPRKWLIATVGSIDGSIGEDLVVEKVVIHKGMVKVRFTYSISQATARRHRFFNMYLKELEYLIKRGYNRVVAAKALHVTAQARSVCTKAAKAWIKTHHLDTDIETLSDSYLENLFPEELVGDAVKFARFAEVQGKVKQMVMEGMSDSAHPSNLFKQEAAALQAPIEKLWFPVWDRGDGSKWVGPWSSQGETLAKIFSELMIFKATQEVESFVKYVHVIETEGSVIVVMEELLKNLPDKRGSEPLGGDLCDFFAYVDDHKEDVELQKFWRKNWKSILRQIVEAVNALHLRDIVHMDLKPENFWLIADLAKGTCRVIMLDFATTHHLQAACTGGVGYNNDPPPNNYGGPLPAKSTDMYRLGLTIFSLRCETRPWADFEKREDLEDGEILTVVKRGYGHFEDYGSRCVFRRVEPEAEVLEVLKMLLSTNPADRGTTAELLRSRLLTMP